MAGIKYDTGGSAVMTKAIDELINRFPGWTEELFFHLSVMIREWHGIQYQER